MEHQFSDAEDSEGAEDDGDEVDEEDEDEEDYEGASTPRTRSRSTSPYGPPSVPVTAAPPQLTSDLLGFGYFPTVPSIRITALPAPGAGPGDGTSPSPGPSSRLSSPGPELSGCPSPVSPSSSPLARRYLSPHRDAHLSPRRDLSPLRHVSPKRDLGVAGGYRRDLSPRRGPLSLLSPAGRDYKREVSPRGRHRGLVRAASPRRGLYHPQHLRPHRCVAAVPPL